MSILISNNSNTIYVTEENATIPHTTKDPRNFNEAMQIYTAKLKNNLTSPNLVKHHKAICEKFISDHKLYCCLNCYAFVPGEKYNCFSCNQIYCQKCRNFLNVSQSCPSCK